MEKDPSGFFPVKHFEFCTEITAITAYFSLSLTEICVNKPYIHYFTFHCITEIIKKLNININKRA